MNGDQWLSCRHCTKAGATLSASARATASRTISDTPGARQAPGKTDVARPTTPRLAPACRRKELSPPRRREPKECVCEGRSSQAFPYPAPPPHTSSAPVTPSPPAVPLAATTPKPPSSPHPLPPTQPGARAGPPRTQNDTTDWRGAGELQAAALAE